MVGLLVGVPEELPLEGTRRFVGVEAAGFFTDVVSLDFAICCCRA
jgi:hypothetical protein